MERMWSDRLPASNEAKEMLVGAYDVHVHGNPSYGPNCEGFDLDDFEIIKAAREAGLKGVCVKNLEFSTTFRDYLVNKVEKQNGFGSCVYYSSMVLNECVGGINPCAVDFAIQHGAKCIWFPTYSARNTAELFGWGVYEGWPKDNWFSFTSLKHSYGNNGISIFDHDGKMIPEVNEIIEITRDANVCLASGHMTPKESYALCKAAIKLGHKKMILTHPDLWLTLVPKEMVQSLATLGVWIEKTFYAHVFSHSDERAFGHIKDIGYKHFFFDSDAGQPNLILPTDAFAVMIDDYLKNGFNSTEIVYMVREVPEFLMVG
jgi:hypothetical protein